MGERAAATTRHAQTGTQKRTAAKSLTSVPRPQAPVFHAAGFWRRLLGGLADLTVIILVSLLLWWIVASISGLHLPATRARGPDWWLQLLLESNPALVGILGLTLTVAVIYAVLFQILWGRTPGMRLVKTRIIDSYGDRPTLGRVAARTAGYIASLATLALGFLWIGFDTEKRGLHDWIAQTYVVKT